MNYFTDREFKCHCCGQSYMKDDFMQMLNTARGISETPYIIMSGYRCPKHDSEVGGKGNHSQGTASDIKCESGEARLKIIRGLLSAGFKRIGVGKDFIHADTSPGRPPSIWLY